MFKFFRKYSCTVAVFLKVIGFLFMFKNRVDNKLFILLFCFVIIIYNEIYYLRNINDFYMIYIFYYVLKYSLFRRIS